MSEQAINTSNLKQRFTREYLILTAYTLFIWWLTYLPLGFIMGFNLFQWEAWFTIGTIYDILMAYLISKATIIFDTYAKKRSWY